MARVALGSVRKLARMNRPSSSRHELRRLRDLPNRHVRRLPSPLQSFAFPLEPARADLVHTFGLVPITRTPWIATFGQYLPRPYAPPDHPAYRLAERLVSSERCRALIAQSEYARRVCLDAHRGCDHRDDLDAKMTVILPTVPSRVAVPPANERDDGRLRIVFIGLDFARKGGIVALRAARQAVRIGLPVDLHVVSGLDIGDGWIDHPDRARHEPDLDLLGMDNVTHHGRLAYADAQAVVAAADLQVMPTIDDNFGYSVIEGFSYGVPTIATPVGALPEMIEDGVSGILLPLDTNALGQWIGRDTYDTRTGDAEGARVARSTDAYWELLDATWTSLADGLTEQLVRLCDEPDVLMEMRAGARQASAERFDSDDAARRIDEVYDVALGSFDRELA